LRHPLWLQSTYFPQFDSQEVVQTVLGTWLVAILDGQPRYALDP
jgi:hypothetical protein